MNIVTILVNKLATMSRIPTPAVAQQSLRSRFARAIALSRWLNTLASSARLRASRNLRSHSYEHMGIDRLPSLKRVLRVGFLHTVQRLCALITLVAAHLAGFKHYVGASAQIVEVGSRFSSVRHGLGKVCHRLYVLHERVRC